MEDTRDLGPFVSYNVRGTGEEVVVDAMVVFEAVEFCEPALEPGQAFPGTQETVLGEFPDELDAVEVARSAWLTYRDAPNADVMWWLVRKRGDSLARWIGDGHSPVERVLDLRTNELVPVL